MRLRYAYQRDKKKHGRMARLNGIERVIVAGTVMRIVKRFGARNQRGKGARSVDARIAAVVRPKKGTY